MSDFPQLGYMIMPPDFPYRTAFLQGRPRHEGASDFSRKHPRMDCSRRAKLFMPFDALKGFNDAIDSVTRKVENHVL